MIGPHEGRELELMLKGEKHLAVFFDVLTDEGISEDIIPELSFSPYVAQGKFTRRQRDIFSVKGDTIRVVCFTTPENEWRADFIFWTKEALYKDKGNYHEAHDVLIGQLLGYTNNDIEDFLNRQKTSKAA